MVPSEIWGYSRGDEVEVRVYVPQPDQFEWVYGKVVDFTAERTVVVRLRPEAGGAAEMSIALMPNAIRRFVMPTDVAGIEAFLAQGQRVNAEDVRREDVDDLESARTRHEATCPQYETLPEACWQLHQPPDFGDPA